MLACGYLCVCARVFECMRASARPFFYFGFSFVLFRLVLAMCVLFSFFRSSSSSFSNLSTINNTISNTHTLTREPLFRQDCVQACSIFYLARSSCQLHIFSAFLLFLLLMMTTTTAMMIQARILLSLQMNGMASTQRSIHQTKTEWNVVLSPPFSFFLSFCLCVPM